MTTAPNLETSAPAPFSRVIRDATFGDHQTAAMSGFMTALFDGALPREAYTDMVAQHWFAYVELERAGDALADHPVAGAFAVEELRRVPSLEADLAHLLGAGWRDVITPNDATRRYCERMAEVCVEQPERFVAHHYTRYLGDLSGGQMIGRIARRVYELDAGAGAAFYDFPDIADLGAFKDEYRARLDAAPWTQAQREALLAEVMVAYRLNTEVFDDLDRDLAAAGA